jgi:phosphatidylglycerophosphatase A
MTRKDKDKEFFEFMRIAIASGFGLGLSPIAPGTCGALLGILIHGSVVFGVPQSYQVAALVLSFLLICIAHFWLTPWAVKYWHSEDPKNFVLDEVAGYLLVPIGFHHEAFLPSVLWGFILFRLFDIVKIPPAKQIDRDLHGGWGILLDDLVSAGYAIAVLYFLRATGIAFDQSTI